MNTRRPLSAKQKRAAELLTIEEAAEVAGITPKAIRGRLDRGTLDCIKVRHPGRKPERRIPFESLDAAGLVGVRKTKTGVRVDKLIRELKGSKPGREFTTNELLFSNPAFHRQTLLIVLYTLHAAGLVDEVVRRPLHGYGGSPVSYWAWRPNRSAKRAGRGK